MAEFDRALPPLGTLVAFEAAYRHGSFTRASQELHLSQASVSRRIRELEDDLGVQLFERHRYDVTPTADGESFAASVRLSLHELAAAASRLRRGASRSNSLTIMSSLSLASAVVAPVLATMQRSHPALTVRLLSACESVETTVEAFDVALQYGPSESRNFTVEYLADEAVFPVCSPTVAAELPIPMSPSQLRTLPLLHLEYDDPDWITWATFFGAEGVEATVDESRVFTSYQVCLDVAEQGEGIALGWERSVRPRLDAGTLVRLPGVTVADAGRISAYLPNRGPANPYVDECVDLLRTALANEAN